MARVPDDEFKPTKDDMVFDEEELAIINEGVKASEEAIMKEYEKIKKTW